MMLKQKSNPWTRLKYLYVLPLTAVAVVAFARPEISRELEKISSAQISEIVPVKDSLNETKEVLPYLEAMNHQLDNFTTEANERMKKVKQRVESSQYLILIDNEVSDYDQLDQIPRDDIEAYSLETKESGASLLKKFHAEDKKGVIYVVTKKGVESGKVKKEPILVLIDGVEKPEMPLNEIDPNSIASISILKDKSAIEQYGVKAKNGVILVTTKQGLLNKTK